MLRMHRRDKSHLIICFRTIGGHRRISADELEKITKNNTVQTQNFTEGSTAVYYRVSSHDKKKKGDLKRQISAFVHFCSKMGINNPLIFRDIA